MIPPNVEDAASTQINGLSRHTIDPQLYKTDVWGGEIACLQAGIVE